MTNRETDDVVFGLEADIHSSCRMRADRGQLAADMVFGPSRAMRVEDYFQQGKRWWLRLHEKGGKRHEVPAHHNAEAYLDTYLGASGFREDKKQPLFQTLNRGSLTGEPMHRVDVLRMVKRRAENAGIPLLHLLSHAPGYWNYGVS